jgi:hypothetical protein
MSTLLLLFNKIGEIVDYNVKKGEFFKSMAKLNRKRDSALECPTCRLSTNIFITTRESQQIGHKWK